MPQCTARILPRRSRKMPPLQWPTLSAPGTLCEAASELGAEHRQSVEGRHAVAEYSFAVQLEGVVTATVEAPRTWTTRGSRKSLAPLASVTV